MVHISIIDKCPKENSENFLSHHKLFWAVHCNKWCFWDLNNLDKIKPSAFNIRNNENMSVDWSKHCKGPEETYKFKQDSKRNGIMEITVEALLSKADLVEPPLALEHTPFYKGDILINCAHSEILNFPPKEIEKIPYEDRLVHIRAILVDLPECKWAIKPKTENCFKDPNKSC